MEFKSNKLANFSTCIIVAVDKGSVVQHIKNLEEAMNTQFMIRYGDTEKDDEDDSELDLSVFSGKC